MDTPFPPAALEFARQHPLSHVATLDGAAPDCRVMHIARVDDDFTLWYATFAGSAKARQLERNPAVCVSCSDGARNLRLYGTALLHSDAAHKAAHWQPLWARYFPGGADDPRLVIMQVQVARAELA